MNAHAATEETPDSNDSGDTARAQIMAISTRPLPEPAKILRQPVFEKFPDCAILFYGSGNSIGASKDPTEIIFDFYVIGPSDDALFSSRWIELANKILPPNVFI